MLHLRFSVCDIVLKIVIGGDVSFGSMTLFGELVVSLSLA